MSVPPPVLTQAYTPYADRVAPGARGRSPEGLARWLALLIFFLLEPLNAVRLLCSGRLTSRWHDRPDLPAGSAQDEAASIRGWFGTAIAWMCLRHGIGPGHADWPEMSRAIVAFGGSLKGFRAGRPALGLQWWENPNVVQGFVVGFGTPAAAGASLLEQLAAADALPPAPSVRQAEATLAVRAEATHARLPASWLSASRQHIFARAGPGPSTGPPSCPGLQTSMMFDTRGQSMAGPAVLIRAAP